MVGPFYRGLGDNMVDNIFHIRCYFRGNSLLITLGQGLMDETIALIRLEKFN